MRRQNIIVQQKCYFLIILFLFVFKTNGQSPYYYSLSEENGLPSSEVYQIIQDDFGYIWIGCDAGLYMYDGIRFKSFNSKKQNSRSISGIKIDKDKNIWCQNFTGQILRVTGDSLTLVIDISKNIASYTEYTVDTKKRVWVANQKQIEWFNFKGESLGSIVKVNNNNDTIIWQEIEVNNNGQIFASSQNSGFARINEKFGKYEVEFLNVNIRLNQRSSFEVFNNDLFALTEINPKRQYIVSIINQNNVVLKNKLVPFSQDGLFYKFYKDNLNRFWLCTSTGIISLNHNFELDKESKLLFKNDKISNIYQDREGNLWVSSLQNGIYVIPNYDLILYNEQNSSLLDHNITALLKTNKNELLLGTYTGSVYKLNSSNNFELFPQQSEIAYRSVKKMQESQNGVYIAHGALSYYQNNKETLFKAYNFRDFCLIGDTLFYVNSNMFAYLPSFHKINRDEYGRSFIKIHNKGCRSLTLDQKNRIIYFASIDGLFKYENGKTTEVKINSKSIYANKLFFIHDKLWIGTFNNGVYVVKNDEEVAHYFDKYLLNGKSVKSFKVLENHLYVATEEGLTKINYLNNTSEFYDYTDGVVSKEINDVECWNSGVYLATNKGLLKLPNNIQENKVYPNIELTSLKINQNSVSLNNKYFDLQYYKNNISIAFNTSCLKARGNFKYKYRLIGLDTNWLYASSINNQVQYASLPSGNFTFEVKAINEDGFESEKASTLHFTIKKPFWQTWWFYILIGLMGVLLTGIISALIIKNIKRKSQTKNDLISSQLTAIRAQMNPHFMYNTLNSIQDLILKSDIKNTNYYLSKFSTLMRKILEFSENENVLLEEEIEMLNSYLELEKLRFGNEFKFKIEVEEGINTSKTFLPSLIIQPFVENAIKHGLLHKKGEKNLSIIFSISQTKLLVIIEDNGVGRKRSEEIKSRSRLQHKSFATSAVKKRLELLNSNEISVISFTIFDLHNAGEPAGTKVEITISC
ncbi:MAG: histidine kinase [Bacteroidota bacterium]|nr:histidine kinase [Bacteroidota bacterium]